VIHNGVEHPPAVPDDAPRRDLVFLGRVEIAQKGLDLLLDAFARLASGRPELRLVAAGRGRDAERFAALVRARGLESRVQLIANPEPARTLGLLAGALALAMPSRFEGFGMVAAEAMAAGVPVVAAAVDAVPGVLGAEGGLLVPPEDAGALAHALGRTLDEPGLRARLSAAGRERARLFSWDRVSREHLDWLRRIAASRT
jgi:glycogen synthase